MKFYSGDIVEALHLRPDQEVNSGSIGYYEQNKKPIPRVGMRFIIGSIGGFGTDSKSCWCRYRNGELEKWMPDQLMLYRRPIKNHIKRIIELFK